jgi:OmpA family/Carboxypeptidase regulatory-like domain
MKRVLFLILFVAFLTVGQTAFARGVTRSNLGPGIYGTTGLLNVESAYTPPYNTFSLKLYGNYWRQMYFINSKTHERMEGIASFSYSPRDDVEVAVSGIGSAHSVFWGGNNPRVDDFFIQTLGDYSFSAKYGYDIANYMYAGAFGRMRFYTRMNDVGIVSNATSMGFKALYTVDLSKYRRKKMPWRFHANWGYWWDNSNQTMSRMYDSDQSWNASTFTAMGARSTDQMLVGLAAEWLDDELFVPFIEYSGEIYRRSRIGREGDRSWISSPQRLTPGVRITPLDWINFDVAMDLTPYFFGFGKRVYYDGVMQPTQPKYVLQAAINFFFDPAKIFVDNSGYLRGRVIDEEGNPIQGVQVDYPGRDLSSQVTSGDDGDFLSYPFPPEAIQLRVWKEGYTPVTEYPEIIAYETVSLEVVLKASDAPTDEQAANFGAIVGRVVDGDSGEPVSCTAVFIEGGQSDTHCDPRSGIFQKILPVGTYTIRVESEGFQSRTFRVPIQVMKKTVATFQLYKEQPAGAFKGHIFDETSGKPISGVITFFERFGTVHNDQITGEFFKILPKGVYKIEVSAEGYRSKVYKIPIEVGKVTVVDFYLPVSTLEGAIKGTVVDCNNRPLAANVDFGKPEIPPVKGDPGNGRFFAKLAPDTYLLTISAEGQPTRKFKVPVMDGRVTIYTFKLCGPAAAGLVRKGTDRLMLPPETRIEFDPGSSKLKPESFKLLDEVAEIIKSDPALKISVEGHTSDVGSATDNLKLSQERSRAVMYYLISKGVEKSRLSAIGFGEMKPIAPNVTEKGRWMNERIEFKFMR